MNLKRRDGLLADLAFKLKVLDQSSHGRTPLGTIEVALVDDKTGKTLQTGSLSWALDVLANDLFFDEEADWTEATSVRVRVI